MHEIVGDDGFPAVWVVGEHNAKTVTRLMTLAHEHGVFERITEKKQTAPTRCRRNRGIRNSWLRIQESDPGKDHRDR